MNIKLYLKWIEYVNSVVNYMENDKQIVLDKLYEIIDSVERLDSAVDNVSHMIIEKLGNEGDQY